MNRFVLAPDSFKGTMDAQEVCDIWVDVIHRHIPDAVTACFPMADGGEGMVNAYLRICGGEPVHCTVSGPYGKPVNAAYGILPDGTAVIEMASSAGLHLAGETKNPLITSTFGVGELLLDAARRGVKNVILGLGGSCTNDCGIGMAAAIGYRFTGKDGHDIEPLAKNMQSITRIIPPEKLPDIVVTAACDVDNPLYGPAGATYTFGMQKGADDKMLAFLEAGLINMAKVIEKDLGADIAAVPGTGAAGGLGAGVMAFLGGTLKPGIELLLDAVRFDEALQSADMVFTGEGRIDWQSVRGKAPVGISRRAKKWGVPCIALCGSIGKNAAAVLDEGITAFFSSVSGASTLEEIKATCRDDMRTLTDAVIRTLLIGNR
jgi:glycerate kinase